MVHMNIKLHKVFRWSSAQDVDFFYKQDSYKPWFWELGKIWRVSTGLKHLNLIRTLWNIPQGSMTAARGHHEGLQWESSLISILFTSRAQGAKAIRKTRETKLSQEATNTETSIHRIHIKSCVFYISAIVTTNNLLLNIM